MKQAQMRQISLDTISAAGALRQLKHNLWVILCVGLAVFLGAGALGELGYLPEYTAEATLVIRRKDAGTEDAYTLLTQTSKMALVYSEVFESQALQDRIAQNMGDMDTATIRCTPIEESNLLSLQVTASTPRQAFTGIQTALEVYQQVTGDVFSEAMLQVLQSPAVPRQPSNRSIFAEYRLPLALLAAVASAVLILAGYLLQDGVKRWDTAGRLLPGRMLGVLPCSKHRTGLRRDKPTKALLLCSSLVSMDFAQAARRMVARLEAHLQKHSLQVVLVDSVAENEGKSTVSANLAIALAQRGRRVALLDCDLRKPAQWRIFGAEGEAKPSLSDLIGGRAELEQALSRNSRCGLWQIFQFQAVDNPVAVFSNGRLAEILQLLRGRMDYIILDSAPLTAAVDAELLMHLADTAVLVVRQEVSRVRDIRDAADLIRKHTGDFAGYVLNGFQE